MKTIKTEIRLKMTFMALILMSTLSFAQNNSTFDSTSKRDDFIFEFSLGGGVISIEDSEGLQTFDKAQGAISFPELKFGYMLNDKLALTASMPGMIYDFQDNDRHFGGFIPSVQYWVKDRLWIHGGIGLAIDSPALYDIKENVNDDWNFGCAVMASTGYEFYKKKNFSFNVQSKLVMGRAFLEGDAQRDIVTFNIGLGFSWF
ncbi:hypothetical protein FIA58_020805 [Flavobacterium jejuense]|uniref:Outer membrane protein beta-barrel domain-containing protein n=1 Tax=Flavobacterium jejuense TaxID=1544455 RepID=A0ABX0IYA6_9FLAO|nr:hypothetical protein [Flavobacterium jejuense]NHN28126.1 hypothetical protein [Flavobacterium jejuense]